MEKASLITRRAALMGSPFSIQAYVPESRDAHAIEHYMDLAFGEIARIEDLLTDFRDSPFNRINDMAGVKPVAVPREILDVLELSLRISRDSEGAFDISYASVGRLWREAVQKGEPPRRAAIERAKRFVNFRDIQIDEIEGTVFLPHREMRIGLGGIGKGYAVDRAFQLLRNLGLENFVINGAGDIHAHASPEAPRPWRIGIRNPFAERDVAMGFLEIRTGAVATSGDYERFFRHRGKNYHHVLDGRTGEVTEGVCSVTILADSTTTADVCATTAMALGPSAGLAFLNRRRNVSGFLVTQSGEVLKTSALSAKGVFHDAV